MSFESQQNSIEKDCDKSVEFLVKEKSDERRFQRFNELQQSPRTFIIAGVAYFIFITFSLIENVFEIVSFRDKVSGPEEITSVSHLVVDVILLALIVVIMISKHNDTVWNYDPSLDKISDIESNSRCSVCRERCWLGFVRTVWVWRHRIQNAFILLNCFHFSLHLLAQVSFGPCHSHLPFGNVKLCDTTESHDGHPSLPLDTLIALILIPTAFNFITRNTHIHVVITTWLITTVTITLTTIWVDWKIVITPVLLYATCMSLIYYESHRQNLAMYALATRIQNTLSENERQADETHANEMRAMIANVAHDLKTPLTSFMSGVDLIGNLLEDCEDRLRQSDIGAAVVEDQIVPMRSCLSNVQNTNAFMIMTINRCIDYTKASKGMKLVPKPETIDLRETLMLPLRVMRNLQQRLEIKLDESNLDDICSHIITDKQWLQENLLCLLSNAVKYSSKGTVDITISLTPKSRVSKLQIPAKSRSRGPGTLVTPDKSPPASKSYITFPKLISFKSSSASIDRKSLRSSNSRNSISPTFERMLNSIRSNGSKSEERDIANAARGYVPFAIEEHAADAGKDAPMKSPRHSGSLRMKSALVVPLEGAAQQSAELPETQQRKVKKAGDEMFVLVKVQDTGIGLTDEAMKNLFNPFKQAQRLAGGTGLGLYSLAKRLEALGGYYGVRKRRDGQQGSLFWFAFAYRPDDVSAHMFNSRRTSVPSTSLTPQSQIYCLAGEAALKDKCLLPTFFGDPTQVADGERCEFPMKQGKNPESKETLLTNNSASDSPQSVPQKIYGQVLEPIDVSKVATIPASVQRIMDKYTIPPNLDVLLVDDSLPILKMTTSILKRHGHRVTQVENGAEAVEILMAREVQNQPFDFVLMDLQMPVMDGLEAARRLRANEIELTTHNPRPQPYHHFVIGCSANSDDETRNDALEAGVDAFMSKPFSADSLYAILGGSRLEENK